MQVPNNNSNGVQAPENARVPSPANQNNDVQAPENARWPTLADVRAMMKREVEKAEEKMDAKVDKMEKNHQNEMDKMKKNHQNEMEKLEKRIEKKHMEAMGKLEQRVEFLRRKTQSLESNLETTKKERDENADKAKRLKGDVQTKSEMISKLDNQVMRLRRELTSQKENLGNLRDMVDFNTVSKKSEEVCKARLHAEGIPTTITKFSDMATHMESHPDEAHGIMLSSGDVRKMGRLYAILDEPRNITLHYGPKDHDYPRIYQLFCKALKQVIQAEQFDNPQAVEEYLLDTAKIRKRTRDAAAENKAKKPRYINASMPEMPVGEIPFRPRQQG